MTFKKSLRKKNLWAPPTVAVRLVVRRPRAPLAVGLVEQSNLRGRGLVLQGEEEQLPTFPSAPETFF